MRSAPDYAIWLYGSHSRGVVDEFSDIDVLLVSESELEDSVVHDVFESPTGISISRYSWEEMERMAEYGSLFLRHVALEGRVVFETAQARGRLAKVFRGLGQYRLAWRDLAGFRTVLQDVGTSIAAGHASLVFESSTLGTVFRHACILGCALEGAYCFSRTEPVRRMISTLGLPVTWALEFPDLYRYRLYADGRAAMRQRPSIDFVRTWCGRTRMLLETLEERFHGKT